MTSKLNLASFSKEYIIDIPEIDEQHAQFFDILGKIGTVSTDLYRPLDEEETDTVIDILDELREYALYHFRTEESYMRDATYPGLATQRKEHNRFITDVIRMEAELMNGSSMPAITIRNFMQEWYHDHIMKLDKPFGTFYNKNNTK